MIAAKLLADLAALLARPEGATVTDGQARIGRCAHSVRNHYMAEAASGRAWSCTLVGGKATRWFSAEAARDAWVAEAEAAAAAARAPGIAPDKPETVRSGHRQRQKADAIDALLARPQGATAMECVAVVTDCGLRAMSKRLQHLVMYSKAWSTKTSNSLQHRWFLTAAARDAWLQENPILPTRRALKAARLAADRTPKLVDTLLAVVRARGAVGTLPCDLAEGVGRPSGAMGSWTTDLERRGLVVAIKYKGVRIICPAGVVLTAAAMAACQRRIDKLFSARTTRGVFRVVPAKPGCAPGVTLGPRNDWRNTPASNSGQVVPTICPAPKFDHRYQVDPATRVLGGFATMRPGQYDMPASNAVSQVLANQQRAAA